MVDQRTLPEGEEEEEQDDNELIVLDPEHVCWFSFNIYSKTIYWVYNMRSPLSCHWCHLGSSWQPLVRRQQAALSSLLSKQLERINLRLEEKVGYTFLSILPNPHYRRPRGQTTPIFKLSLHLDPNYIRVKVMTASCTAVMLSYLIFTITMMEIKSSNINDCSKISLTGSVCMTKGIRVK